MMEFLIWKWAPNLRKTSMDSMDLETSKAEIPQSSATWMGVASLGFTLHCLGTWFHAIGSAKTCETCLAKPRMAGAARAAWSTPKGKQQTELDRQVSPWLQ